MTAEQLMLLAGVAAFSITVQWVRKRDLREKYALGWLLVAAVVLMLGIMPGLLKGFASWANLAFASAALFVALAMIYVFAFSVSVSLSRLYRRSIRLTQEMALLEARLCELERQQDHDAADAPQATSRRRSYAEQAQ